ncbi:hypothetical protein HHK36_025624 [Tetracentron sinense]|uniref:PGG domain-containing protein n=1 Tax=Tetracentron sinense TaxID=13715 RepID=A0A834YNJ3_TETSI|nr:hypothetical protein HHK36_025624 [Tetracentron sinense]
MDRRLHEAGLKGDVLAFLDLVREDGNIVGQTIAGSLNTVLHLAAKFGNLELASEIIQLSPKMVSAENGRMETPLYEACLEGHVDIVKLLLEKDPSVAYKVNLHNESALLVACARGQFDVVKHLLSYPKLLLLEDDRLTTPLHAAVSAGHTELYLQGEEMWDMVSGDDIIIPDDDPENVVERKKWMFKSVKALFTLNESIHRDVFEHIVGCTTTYALTIDSKYSNFTKYGRHDATITTNNSIHPIKEGVVHLSKVNGGITLNSMIFQALQIDKQNLVSIAQALDNGNYVLFGSNDVKFIGNLINLDVDIFHTGKWHFFIYDYEELCERRVLMMTWRPMLNEVKLRLLKLRKDEDIVKEILAARPDFIWKRDFQGCSPLHLACKKGSLEITRELLTLDSDLSSLQDNDGRTPLHWAAMKGHVSILGEILSTSLESAEMLTKQGENILHLAVKNNQYGALKYLAETPSITKLVNMPDNDDNTILHLATARKLTTMVKYLVDRSPIDVNAVNGNGLTALDVVESDVSNSSKSEISNSSATLLICTLQEAGCKSCIQLQHGSAEIQPMAGSKTWKVHGNISNPSAEIQPMVGSKMWKVHENISNDPSSGPKKIMNSRTNYPRKQLRNRREKHELHHQSLQKHELHDQRLRNGRNTIGIIAVLIATVTFGAGINPPGGVQQETGKAIMGRKTPFKVFMVCNNVAFFLSLGTIIILVFAGIIPIARQSMMKLLMATGGSSVDLRNHLCGYRDDIGKILVTEMGREQKETEIFE